MLTVDIYGRRQPTDRTDFRFPTSENNLVSFQVSYSVPLFLLPTVSQCLVKNECGDCLQLSLGKRSRSCPTKKLSLFYKRRMDPSNFYPYEIRQRNNHHSLRYLPTIDRAQSDLNDAFCLLYTLRVSKLSYCVFTVTCTPAQVTRIYFWSERLIDTL